MPSEFAPLTSIMLLAPIGAGIMALLHFWVKFLSPRVQLRGDLQLLKLAREAGVNTKDLEKAIEERIYGFYYKTVDKVEEVNNKKDESVFSAVFMGSICLLFLCACLFSVIDAIRGNVEQPFWTVATGIIFGMLFFYGSFVSFSEAVRTTRRRIRAWKRMRKNRSVMAPTTTA